MITYRIHGGHTLKGDLTLSGAKNAALPLLAASLLMTEGETVLRNVPDLSDIRTMLGILEFLNAKTSFENGVVRVDASKVMNRAVPHDLVARLRGSIVILGPLLARFGEVQMAYPGGCVLGKRPVYAHTEAFAQMGVEDLSDDETLHLKGTLKPGVVILPEFSVTATENVLMAASLLAGTTTIELAAYEPHVQDLLSFLAKTGAGSTHTGPHGIAIEGAARLKATEHTVTSDYLEAGAFIIAAMATKSRLTIHDARHEHLISFLGTLRRAGGAYAWDQGKLIVDGGASDLSAVRIQTNIFPGFPTDLQAPFGVLMTQAKGVSRIFEVLFEGRMAYLYELEKMGAHIEILNSHQALVIGPTPLHGRTVASNDIRAGVAMVIAGLCAEGNTTITDVHYIERGYERLDEKLRSVGAHIERQNTHETALTEMNPA